jgi:hypothetical protein
MTCSASRAAIAALNTPFHFAECNEMGFGFKYPVNPKFRERITEAQWNTFKHAIGKRGPLFVWSMRCFMLGAQVALWYYYVTRVCVEYAHPMSLALSLIGLQLCWCIAVALFLGMLEIMCECNRTKNKAFVQFNETLFKPCGIRVYEDTLPYSYSYYDRNGEHTVKKTLSVVCGEIGYPADGASFSREGREADPASSSRDAVLSMANDSDGANEPLLCAQSGISQVRITTQARVQLFSNRYFVFCAIDHAGWSDAPSGDSDIDVLSSRLTR